MRTRRHRIWTGYRQNMDKHRPADSRMLKKSLFSPAQPRRAETRLFPCIVLASFRPATLRRSFSEAASTVGAFPFAKIHSNGQRPHKVRWVPPRIFTRCGLARGTARLGAPGLGG